MFSWLKLRARVYELESVVRVNQHQLEVSRGEIERLTSERNHLMDALLRAMNVAPMYGTVPDTKAQIEKPVERDHPAPRNMREFQASLQELEQLERKAFS
jgi:hypothetical protein